MTKGRKPTMSQVRRAVDPGRVANINRRAVIGSGSANGVPITHWKEFDEEPSDLLKAIAAGAAKKAALKKGRPEKLLCDIMSDPKLYRIRRHGNFNLKTPVPYQIREYEKIVLDDDAIKMALVLASSTPIQILHMIDAALPPSTKTWIEWSSRAALNTLKEHQEMGLSIPMAPEAFATERPLWARCGVMIETKEDGYHITCVESGETEAQIWEWPVRFVITKTSDGKVDPFAVLESTYDAKITMTGSGKASEQAAVVWGYTKNYKGISNLSHKGCIHVPPHMTLLIAGLADGDMSTARQAHKIIRRTANELSGLTRQVVAILAMLHTSMEVSEPTRPAGRFIGRGGQPKPYAERRVARLLVPGRVRNVEGYVRDRIKDEADRIRHRRHKVKAHFRHSQFLPLNGEGWVRCYCPGRDPGKLWHKKIDEHYRGDAELGFVTHDYTLVSGPDQGE